MTTPTAAAPQFRLSPAATFRALALVLVCVAMMGGFLLQVWRAPAPEPVRAAAAPAALAPRA
jgi:hypothetical protein